MKSYEGLVHTVTMNRLSPYCGSKIYADDDLRWDRMLARQYAYVLYYICVCLLNDDGLAASRDKSRSRSSTRCHIRA